MAGTLGKQNDSIMTFMLDHPKAFSFYQMLRLMNRDGFGLSQESTNRKTKSIVRIRPNLSLTFPASDVEEVIKKESGREDKQEILEIIVNFLGIYGVTTPLPLFYTEELIDEYLDVESSSREFIDILNSRFYEFLYQGWLKHKNLFQMIEQEDENHSQRIFSFFGLHSDKIKKTIPDNNKLLKYIGLLSMSVKSALGLETLISDAFGNIDVQVIQCLESPTPISEDQKCQIGEQKYCLGKDTFMGDEIKSHDGWIKLEIGPVNEKMYRSFFKGSENYDYLIFLVDYYTNQSCQYRIEIKLDSRRSRVHSPKLGIEKWGSLGIDSWFYEKKHDIEITADICREQ